MPSTYVKKFADDATFIDRGVNETDNNEEVLRDVREWCLINQSVLNEDKTKILTIPLNDNSNIGETQYDEEALKVLGLTLDKKYIFSKHVMTVTKKMTREITNVYLVNRLKIFGMVKTDLSYVYNTLVKTQFEYAVSAWASTNEQYLVTIGSIQKLSVRLSNFDEFETVKDIMRTRDKKTAKQIAKFSSLYMIWSIKAADSYADEKLRHRRVLPLKKYEATLKLFPLRVFRINHF